LTNPQSNSVARYLPCARVKTSHGVKGEFKIFCLSPNLEEIEKLTLGHLRLKNQVREIEIEHIRGSLPNLIMKIKGIDSPEAVRLISGAEILRKVDPQKELSTNEFFAQDLVGVELELHGEYRGKILSVWENAASDMLEIEKSNGTIVHIPFLQQFVGDVNIETKKMELLVDWILE